MTIDVTIQLSNVGVNAGPFDLYSNVDSFAVAFESGIPASSMALPYTSTLAPYGTTVVRIKSTGVCTTSTDVAVNGATPSVSLTEIALINVVPNIVIIDQASVSVDNGNYDIHFTVNSSIKNFSVSLDDPLQTWASFPSGSSISGYGAQTVFTRVHFNNTSVDRSVNVLIKNDNQTVEGTGIINIFQSA